MRWLPDRRHPQHWALRLFQIAQVTALGTIPLILAISAIGDRQPITLDGSWFPLGLVFVAWAIFFCRCGWPLTLLLAGAVIAALMPVDHRGNADAVMLTRILAFGLAGLAVGGFLDAIGLATRAAVDYSNAWQQIDDSPDCSGEHAEPPPPITGDSP